MADYVSIFYRDNGAERLECIASTGLWAQDGSKIPGEAPFKATYEPNEGLTGMTFASGEVAVRRAQDETRLHAQKYRDLPLMSKETSAACIIHPILLPGKPARDDPSPRRAIGVIRCARNHSDSVSPYYRNFHAFEIQTLDFIAQQIAPALEALSLNIDRERRISILRHEIFQPLEMIAHRIRSLSLESKQGEGRHESARKDINFALFFAKSLAASLDYGPWHLKDISPSRVLLEEMLHKLLDMLSHFAAESNGIKVELIRHASIPPLFIDIRLVERAVWVLLLNAVKYGKPGSTVTVTTRQSATGYNLDVANKGIGISETRRPAVVPTGISRS